MRTLMQKGGKTVKDNRVDHQKKNRHGHRIIALAATIRETGKEEIPSDVLGSYTGTAEDQNAPEQDADDL